MEKLKALILSNLDKHSHFEEYFKIIDIVVENENTNPDICIESCKALIEGISKTILLNLDKTKSLDSIDDDNLPKLYKEAMTLLSRECEDIEGDFVLRFSSIINVLAEIRNKRGDISHGRMAPKPIFSSYKLAGTIANMTEGFLAYILEHYFSLDLNPSEKLNFGSDEMQSYNAWLDESVDFPITKARYSELLYEHDYDEYEIRYTDDYLKSLENGEEKAELQEVEPSDETPPINIEFPKESVEPDEEPENEDIINANIERRKRQKEIWFQTYFGPKEVKPIEELINTFDETAFWTEQRTAQVASFAEVVNINPDGLKDIISNYLFTQKRPFRNETFAIMNEKPTLRDRGRVTEELTDKIVVFAKDLTQPKE